MKRSTISFIGSICLTVLLCIMTIAFVNTKEEYRTDSSKAAGIVQHYLYVMPDDGKIYIYDIDNAHTLVNTITLPSNVTFVRGIEASVNTHILYISYGGTGGSYGAGSLFAYNLITNKPIFDTHYTTGIDSFGITSDGKTIYMPEGDSTGNGIWQVIDAATGNITGSINTLGSLPHNTIVGPSQKKVYLGARGSQYLYVADTATNQIIQKIGPVKSGVRPFTINSSETLAYIITSGFLGFQVGDINTGKILYSVPVSGFISNAPSYDAPSHGISLSPDEKEIYIVDFPNNHIHVFDVSGLPSSAPKQVADVTVHSMQGSQTPCAKTCSKDGWLMHSLDGRFVYVGDAGDVIDTRTRQSVAYLPPLANTKEMLEIDWQNGMPILASSRVGEGHITGVTYTSTPTTTPTNIQKTPTSIPTQSPITPTVTSTHTTIPTATKAIISVTTAVTYHTPTATTLQSTLLPTTKTSSQPTSTQISAIPSIQTTNAPNTNIQTTSSISNSNNIGNSTNSSVVMTLVDSTNNPISHALIKIIASEIPFTTDNLGVAKLPANSTITSVNINGKSIPTNINLQSQAAYTLKINTSSNVISNISKVDTKMSISSYLLYTAIIACGLIFIAILIILYLKKKWIFKPE